MNNQIDDDSDLMLPLRFCFANCFLSFLFFRMSAMKLHKSQKILRRKELYLTTSTQIILVLFEGFRRSTLTLDS